MQTGAHLWAASEERVDRIHHLISLLQRKGLVGDVAVDTIWGKAANMEFHVCSDFYVKVKVQP